MMIDKYIKELLNQQTSVSIPKLGTFTATQENAQTDTDQNVIQPPRKKISFSTDTQEGDTTLRDAVIQDERIDQEDYELQLNKFLESIDAQIITFGEYKIKDLGVLTKSEQGAFVFKPDTSLGDSFGLPPVDAQPIARTETPKTAPKPEPKPQKATSNNTTFLLIVIPLICLLAFLVFLSTHKGGLNGLKSLFSSPQTEEVVADNTDTTPIDEGTDDTAAEEDVAPVSAEDEADNTLQDVVDAPQDNAEEATPPPAESLDNSTSADVSDIVQGKFYIVAGSFSSVKSAQPLLDKMKEVQNIKIVPYTAKNMYRVVVGEFEDEASATAKMSELSATYGEMWVTKM